MKITDSLLRDVHILLHPVRYRIVELLMDEPMHINEISREVNIERRLVSYHLLTLEEHGFVKSNYEISEHPRSKGRAIRKYEPTEKVKHVLSELRKILEMET